MTDFSNIFITNIEKDTTENGYYRKILFTSGNQQLVLMSIDPYISVPTNDEPEIHIDNDQFIRIEKGNGKLYIGRDKETKYDIKDGDAIIIPANTYHLIRNVSDKQLKLYTIYSPPHHDANKAPEINPPYSQNCKTHNDDQKGGKCGCQNFRKDNRNYFDFFKKQGFMY
jgi:mannose-6-phosphate isomerase-like protein (cupin superfamily)